MTEAAASDGILTGFLPALNAQIAESVAEVTGEVENALHQKMESTGNKRRQARQLNAVAKSSGKYMSKVHRAFEKNFDKFELYVRRNIVSVPAALADEVAQLRAEKKANAEAKEEAGGKEGTNAVQEGVEAEDEEFASLSKEEQQERRLDKQLEALRLQLRELSTANQRLELEQKALDDRTLQFQGLITQVAFLEDMPERAVSPLKRTAEHISALHGAFQQMDGIQTALEEDSRQFKRSKVATRGTFRNLRKRFTARTSEMTYITTEDLQQLHAKLQTM